MHPEPITASGRSLLAKRALDVIASILGLVLLGPLLVAIACWVRLDSPGPAWYRQARVGRRGSLFRIHKFRTMHVGSDQHQQLTRNRDPRITRAGRFLRRSKLDELPQLVDVLLGSMSLVGPRPEVPRYVAHYPATMRDAILSVRPGMTDWASLRLIDEDRILATFADHEDAYLRHILPDKIRMHLEYVRTGSVRQDLHILGLTLLRLVKRTPHGDGVHEHSE